MGAVVEGGESCYFMEARADAVLHMINLPLKFSPGFAIMLEFKFVVEMIENELLFPNQRLELEASGLDLRTMEGVEVQGLLRLGRSGVLPEQAAVGVVVQYILRKWVFVAR